MIKVLCYTHDLIAITLVSAGLRDAASEQHAKLQGVAATAEVCSSNTCRKTLCMMLHSSMSTCNSSSGGYYWRVPVANHGSSWEPNSSCSALAATSAAIGR